MPIDVKPGMTRQDKIAALAGAITQMHLEALDELGQHELNWWDIAFASILALRSVGALHCDEDLAEADSQVRRLFEVAMHQQIVTKRFKNETDMQQWTKAEGIDAVPVDGVAVVPLKKGLGPVH